MTVATERLSISHNYIIRCHTGSLPPKRPGGGRGPLTVDGELELVVISSQDFLVQSGPAAVSPVLSHVRSTGPAQPLGTAVWYK